MIKLLKNFEIDDLPFHLVNIAARQKGAPWIQYWASATGQVLFTIDYNKKIVSYSGQFVCFRNRSDESICDLVDKIISQYNVRISFVGD